MSFDMKALLKNKSKYPDDMMIQVGETSLSLGDLRAYDEAMDGQLDQQLQAEREKISSQQRELEKAREQVVQTYLEMQKGTTQQAAPAPQSTGSNWQDDPFFAPIAKHLETAVMKRLETLDNQYKQIQQAMGAIVRYGGDQISRTKFGILRQQAPENWRNDLKFDELYKIASEQKLLDEGGFPDVEKAYEKWSAPKREQQMREQIRAEIRAEEEANRAQQLMGRPGSGFGVKQPDANAPKNLNDAFNAAKQDPEIMKLIYGGSA